MDVGHDNQTARTRTVRDRPSVKAAIFDRMREADWAPFKNLSPDPGPKVQSFLKAA
jgi:hypothetical protein